MTPKLPSCFILLLTIVQPSIVAKDRWHVLKAGSLTLYTHEGERRGRKLLSELDWYWRLLSDRVSCRAANEEVLLIDLPNNGVFYSRDYPGPRRAVVDGQELILLNTTQYPYSTRRELFLSRMNQCGVKYPLWLKYGLAQLYARAHLFGKWAGFDQRSFGLARVRFRVRSMDFDKLLAADANSDWLVGEKLIAFREWSLRMCLMLVYSNGYAPRYRQFATLLNGGTSTPDALERVYGVNLGQFEMDIRNYIPPGGEGMWRTWEVSGASHPVHSNEADSEDIGRLMVAALRQLGEPEAAERVVERLCPNTCR